MIVALSGLVMMGWAFLLAVKLRRSSPLLQRAGAAMSMGAGSLMVFADALRPDLMPLAIASLCVSLLWMAMTLPVMAKGKT